jgi:hypothetical protein
MPYLGDAEHSMLGALTLSFLGVAELGAAVTSWTSTGTVLTSGAAHGFVNKDLVMCNSVTGGAEGGGNNGLIANRVYWVKENSSTKIELFPIYALTGSAESFNTAVTEASFSKIIEASGGTYARVAVTMETAANRKRKSKAAEEPEIKVKAGQVVDFVLFCSAATEAKTIQAVAKVTKETFAGEGIYKVKEATADQTAAA